MKTKALCLIALVMLGVSPLSAAYVAIDEFEDGSTSPWSFARIGSTSESAGIFAGTVTGNDPYMYRSTSFSATTHQVLELSMKHETGSPTTAQIFWARQGEGFAGSRYMNFPITADGKFHTYRVDMSEHSLWPGTMTALRIDPMSSYPGTDKGIEIHHFRALEMPAYDTVDEFDDGSTSPWSFTRIGSVSESGGTLHGTATAYDPYMSRPADVSASSHLELKLRMKVASGASQEAAVFWTGDWVGSWAGPNSQTFPILADNQWHTYTIPMNAHPRWRGPITGLRIDPFNTGAGLSFEIDYFRASLVGTPGKIVIDDFDDNNRASFWGTGSMQNVTETTMGGVGYLYGETVAGNPADPYLVGTGNANLPADNYPFAEITMAHDPLSEGSTAQIFWVRDGDSGYAGSRHVDFPIIADGQFHTYLVNLGDHALWNGMIRSIRLDPIAGNTTAGRWFMIDSFTIRVPEPGSSLLLAIGILALGLVGRRRK